MPVSLLRPMQRRYGFDQRLFPPLLEPPLFFALLEPEPRELPALLLTRPPDDRLEDLARGVLRLDDFARGVLRPDDFLEDFTDDRLLDERGDDL